MLTADSTRVPPDGWLDAVKLADAADASNIAVPGSKHCPETCKCKKLALHSESIKQIVLVIILEDSQ